MRALLVLLVVGCKHQTPPASTASVAPDAAREAARPANTSTPATAGDNTANASTANASDNTANAAGTDANAAGDQAAAPEEPKANADLNVTIRYASGKTKSGHVIRIERSVDWYGEEGWTDEAQSLVISAESGTTAKDIPWTDVRSIAVRPGSLTNDIDCVYDSDWTPWMYMCTLKTTGTVTTKSGARWTIDTRHKWRLTFDDGSKAEFWIDKWPVRKQDTQTAGLDDTNPENYELYSELQEQLRKEAKTTLVTNVTIQ